MNDKEYEAKERAGIVEERPPALDERQQPAPVPERQVGRGVTERRPAEAPASSPAQAREFSNTFEERGTPEQLAALDKALALASLEFEEVAKDTSGQIGHQTFKYAPLCVLTRATRKALAKHGVTVNQFLTSSPEPRCQRLTIRIAGHGARLVGHLDFARIPDVKEYGKVTTYLRRYQYQAMGVLDGEDADDPPDNRGTQQEQRRR